MTAPTTSTGRYLTDLVERVTLTYVEAFLGLLIVDASNWTVVGDVLSAGRSAAVAAIPAGLALAKTLLARMVGNGDSASLATNV